MPDPSFDNEYSTPKITPADGVKIPSVGENSGYQLDKELRDYIQEGVTGVTEEYSTLMTYAYGKRLKHEGVEYRCIVPVESPEIFDPDKWVKVDLTELDKRVLANADAINAIISSNYFSGKAFIVCDVVSVDVPASSYTIHSFTFKKAFTSKPIVVASVIGDSWFFPITEANVNIAVITTTGADIVTQNRMANAITIKVGYIAIGV